MLINATGCRSLRVIALGLWAAASLAAQTAPRDAAQAYEELLIARRLADLKLTKPQAEAIAPMLQELAKARVRAVTLERGFYLETADAVAAWEMGELRGQPLTEEARRTLAGQCDAYAKSRRGDDQASYATANAVWEKLNEKQRALIESDAAAKVRLAKEDVERRRRDVALRQSTADLAWVRNAEDTVYPTERATRADAIAKAIKPDADAAVQQMITARLMAFYDAVRRMSSVQYNDAQPQLAQQLKFVLDPPMPRAPDAPLMTGAEWVDFIQEPRTLVMLLQLMPFLPAEVAQ